MEVTFIRDDLEERREKELDLEEGYTVKQLLEMQEINSEEVLSAVNNTIVSKEHEISDGDTVRVFDVIAGG